MLGQRFTADLRLFDEVNIEENPDFQQTAANGYAKLKKIFIKMKICFNFYFKFLKS